MHIHLAFGALAIALALAACASPSVNPSADYWSRVAKEVSRDR
jgi:hypothetical protein